MITPAPASPLLRDWCAEAFIGFEVKHRPRGMPSEQGKPPSISRERSRFVRGADGRWLYRELAEDPQR